MEIPTKQRKWRAVECGFLFFVLPCALYWIRFQIAFLVVPILIILTTFCLLYLQKAPEFDKTDFFRLEQVAGHLRSIFVIFFLFGFVFLVFSYLRLSELFLAFPKRRPIIWLIGMILYPILSAVPQEIIFRGFFFHRYGGLFPGRLLLIFFNGLSFGLYHIFFANWYAPLITLLGGWLFAFRYTSSASLLLVAIEHGLWGNFLFTIGLGYYCDSGSIH